MKIMGIRVITSNFTSNCNSLRKTKVNNKYVAQWNCTRPKATVSSSQFLVIFQYTVKVKF